MARGESPQMFTSVLLRRLPQRVRAKRRIGLYDNASNMVKIELWRFPYRMRRWQFWVDRHHLCNHSSCIYLFSDIKIRESRTYNICEQRNRKLRKLANIVAYEHFENYMKIIDFFALTNMEVKGIM